MEIAVFAKKRKSKQGAEFYSYVARMKKKDGTEVSVRVRFREDCGNPKAADCPMNIIVAKEDANMSTRSYVREDNGDLATAYTLWVNKWVVGAPYVDHSLDDFE